MYTFYPLILLDTQFTPAQKVKHLPGMMKLFGDGGTSNPLLMYGELKSSISLLRMIPVDPDMTFEPKLQVDNNGSDMKGQELK